MYVPQPAIDHAEEIWSAGVPEDILAFFAFKREDDRKITAFKFQYWIYKLYPRYIQSEPAPFHDDFIQHMLSAYYGEGNYLNLGFRGCAKSTYAKLFIAFCLLNDYDHHRMYIKVLARNLGNSKQMVTDIFNLIVEVKQLYGNLFPKQKETKGEETMTVFTTVDGVKLMAGTIGMTQRGHLQDAYRPDFLVFDDVEDRESIGSVAQTEATIWRIDEAIQGLSADGSYMTLGNYISEEGVIQWFLNKPNIVVDKVAIVDEEGNPTWPARYTKEKVEAIKNDSDDFYGEYMCLHPDTPILTTDGWKSIKYVKYGDMVITHNNKPQRVIRTMINPPNQMFDITVEGETVTITSNHPVLTPDRGWVEAGDLKEGDLVVDIHRGKL